MAVAAIGTSRNKACGRGWARASALTYGSAIASIPPRHRAKLYSRGGFSLIELLIVMAVIVTLVGISAVALGGRSGEGAALANAQSIASGLVTATRAQAALHQTNARLLIYAQRPATGNPDNTRYLRALQVVREEPFGSNTWIAAGDPVILPPPICVVPPGPVPRDHLNQGVVWNNNPATGPVSTLVRTNMNYRGQSGSRTPQYFGASGPARSVWYLQFGADGSVAAPTGSSIKIALSTAVLSNATFPKFSSANTVRGVIVRRSGAISLVDRADGF